MKVIYGILLAVVSLTSVSCDKLLDTQPQDYYTPDSYYGNKTQLESALAATYSKLGNLQLYGGEMILLGLDADDGFYGAEMQTLGARIYDVSTTDSKVAGFWKTCYEGIARANLLLASIDRPTDIKDDDRAVIRGEALFLRAYYYFLLVSNFGGVPLVLEPLEGDRISIPRAPLEQLYTQILSDMEEAETLVLSASKVGFGGRINKSAVRGVLARVNLYMAGEPLLDLTRYAEARKWALMVMEDAEAGHQLNNDYRQVFINYAADQYDMKESIWEVEFFGNTQGVYREAGRVGTYYGIRYTGEDPNYGYCYGYINATGVLWDKYENPTSLWSYDLRRNWAIAPFELTGTPAKRTAYPISKIYQRDVGKYQRYYEQVLPKEKNYSPMNFPILRFSDVLLMFAEAENYIDGPTEEAKNAVNYVRRRGYGKYLNGESGIAESIREIRITNGGSGYTSNPTITIQGGGGELAKAKVSERTSGSITGITIDDPGQKFSSVPTIVIQGGGGSGATAEAELTQISDADLPADKTINKDVFLKAIQDERSRELCFEHLRKGDLVRWGIMMENMSVVLEHVIDAALPSDIAAIAKTPYQNVSERDVVWPIPAYEKGLNSALTQNKGW